MQLVHANKVYSYILSEDEWYSATGQQRQAWINQIMRESLLAEARFISIMVEPDPVMSISPIAKRHRVWHYTFPTTAEDDLYHEFIALTKQYVGKGEGKLSIAEAATIARKVFG